MQCEQKGNGVPHFRPTEEEFYGGFEEFIKKIEPKCLRFGLAKITPPDSWKPTRKDVEKVLDSMEIPSPIEQMLQGIKGAFQQTNLEAKPMKVRDFQRLADERARRVAPLSEEEKERQFWKTARFDPPLYGADMGGTLTNRHEKHWNIARLDSLLSRCLPDQLQGVTTAYLYFGMWKAMFAWHTEDMDLFSINMLHLGEPKKWYVIPEHERSRFEQVASFHFPDLRSHCPEFLRHKTTLLSPSILHQNNISFFTTVQHARDIIITFPGAYHCGFNMGFNCAESVNFAVESWIPRGMKAKCCRCTQAQDSVYINMDSFLDSYRSLLPSSPSSSSSSSSSSSEASSPQVDPEDEIVLRRNKKGHGYLPACRSSSCPSLDPKSLRPPLDPSTDDEDDDEDDEDVEVELVKEKQRHDQKQDQDDDGNEDEVIPSTPSPRTRRRRSFPSQEVDLTQSPPSSSPRKTKRRDRRKSDSSSTSSSSSSSSTSSSSSRTSKTRTRSVAKKEEEKGDGGTSPRYSLRSTTSPGSSPPKRLREFVITIPRSKFAKSLS